MLTRDTSIFRKDLQTLVSSLTYDFPTRGGTLVMPSGCCTDMSGAIALFTRIDPNVDSIVTVAGEEFDTIYLREGPEWHAMVPTARKKVSA